jgi:hypothetical protein
MANAQQVVEAAKAVEMTPALVVVDTLSQTFDGEENSANEVAAYLRQLGADFRALWLCTVLVIHHSGHSATERPRGSSTMRANVDFLIGVFRDEKEMLATMVWSKQKDGELPTDSEFSLKSFTLEHDEDGEPVTSLAAWHLSSKEEIQEAVEGEAAAGRGGRQSALMSLVQNGMTEKELRKAFYEELDSKLDYEAKKKAFYRSRDRAVSLGQIELVEGFVIDLRRKI